MQEQNEQQKYFQQLLHRHDSSLNQDLSQHLDRFHDKFETHIYNGRYDIREGEIFKKQPSSLSEDELKNMNQIKNKLEGKLQMLESHLERLTDDKPRPGKQMTEQQHQEYLKEIAKINKEVQAKRLERIKQDERKMKERQEARLRLLQQEKSERDRKKKLEIEQKLKKINEMKEKRHNDLELQNKTLNMVIHSKPLFEKLESKYMQFEAMNLEQKKKKLAQLRSLHKPLSKEELMEHQRKIQSNKQKHQKEREKSREREVNEESKSRQSVYKSLWYKNLVQQEQNKDNNEEAEEFQKVKQKHQKIKQYSQYVRTKFRPQIDERKAGELRELNSSVNKIELRGDQNKKIGLQYLKYSKQQINPNAKSATQNESSNATTTNLPKHFNYLDDLKKNRASKDEKTFVEDIMSRPIDSKEKTKKILQHAEKLEELAKRKQQLARTNNQPVNEQLDEIYMKAIKAKLALLN